MNLWNLFLTSKQEQKLNILEEIISKKEVSLDELSNKYLLTNRKLKVLIEQINAEYLPRKNSLILFENRMFKFTANESEEGYPNFYLYLKNYYINQSSVFKLLLFFLEHRKIGMIKLSNHFNYSQSYCYKLINKANEIIIKIGLDCEIRKKTNYIALEGDENQIRSIAYLLNSSSENFISDKKHNYLSRSDNHVSYINQCKINGISKIFNDALKLGVFIDSANKEELEIMEEIYEEIHFGFYSKYSFLLKKESDNTFFDEKMFYYLFTIYYLPNHLSENKIDTLGKRFLALTDNKIVSKASEALVFFETKYSIPNSLREKLVFILVIRFIITQKLRLNILFYATTSIDYNNENLKQISLDIQRLYKGILSNDFLRVFSYQVAELMYSYVGLTISSPLNISINSTYRPNYDIVISNTLNGIYNSDSLKINDRIEQADVVISDSFIDIDESQDFFFLDDIYDLNAWKRLGEFIHEKIIRRHIQGGIDKMKIEN
ncbi:helix-turn-helix domain-containing protein [Enterococcus casseliflavus]|uniref:helix-turn-helix domain-containing protein n=1 Tax=Enterococcus casseliflavus TaxID=37734 RepID=UPI00115E303E|nr:helix-turn-helix domain-containing protein [Enterococcus casseliflavus]